MALAGMGRAFGPEAKPLKHDVSTGPSTVVPILIASKLQVEPDLPEILSVSDRSGVCVFLGRDCHSRSECSRHDHHQNGLY